MTTSIRTPVPNTLLAFLYAHRHKGKEFKEFDAKKDMRDDEEEQQLNRDEAQFNRNLDEQDRAALRAEEREEYDKFHLRTKHIIVNILGFYITGNLYASIHHPLSSSIFRYNKLLGLDTTTSVLTSTLYMLMRHQEVQTQLREEIIKALDGGEVLYPFSCSLLTNYVIICIDVVDIPN
jgi:Cytochrome P450